WYMEGPWPKGEPTQGFQSRLAPAAIYRAAIKAIDAHTVKNVDGKNFTSLTADQQDALLTGLDKGDITLDGADGKAFMTMFWQNTLEGFFSDPIYRGNRDMAGWKLIGFPGARYDYRPYVGKPNVKIDLPPVGLKGGPSWNPA
ncbi:MAG: gluconate 2-dehydrogenase subunit 3 family protein, partial [Hyphomicrobium sp.]|nr:gluconate 2-dehydrogenase subunit 3 family protein [Hyphomicrobium sp.]